MKKILSFVTILALAMFVGCSSLSVKQDYTKEEAKKWQETISQGMKDNAEMPEWYGDENPIQYLREMGTMTEQDYYFLTSLEKKEKVDLIDEDELAKFKKIANGYINGMPREFTLKDENIKDVKGLTRKMVSDSYQRMTNPSAWIAKEVATESEWKKIVDISKKDAPTDSDVTVVRKLLNKFIGRSEFFDTKSWYNVEISERINNVVHINVKEKKTSINENNVNAKALYIAYTEYLSPMRRWDK